MDAACNRELKRLADFEAEVLSALEQSAARQIYSLCERTKAIAADVKSKCSEQREVLQRLAKKGDVSEAQVLRYYIEDIDLATAFGKTFTLEVYTQVQTQIQAFSPGHSQSLAPKSANLYCFSPESNSIFAYHLSSKSHSCTEATYKLKPDAAWTLMGPLLVFYCGGVLGRDSVSDCATFNTLEVKWTQRETMSTGRAQHCAISSDNHVFVFGGYYNHKVLSVCEKYSQASGKWQSTASLLTPLCYVSGTELNRVIYVTGRWSCKIQIYSTLKDHMAEADVLLTDHSGAPMIGIEDHLLILNNDSMYVYTPSSGELKADVRKLGNGGLFWSPCPWVAYGRSLYFFEYGALNVWRYDVSTGDIQIEAILHSGDAAA